MAFLPIELLFAMSISPCEIFSLGTSSFHLLDIDVSRGFPSIQRPDGIVVPEAKVQEMVETKERAMTNEEALSRS